METPCISLKEAVYFLQRGCVFSLKISMLKKEYADIDRKDAGSDVNNLRHFAHESSKLTIRRQQLPTEYAGLLLRKYTGLFKGSAQGLY